MALCKGKGKLGLAVSKVGLAFFLVATCLADRHMLAGLPLVLGASKVGGFLRSHGDSFYGKQQAISRREKELEITPLGVDICKETE